MTGGEIELILQRIDTAVGRIDAAVQQSGTGTGSAVAGAPAPELVAQNARLQAAVTGAIAKIDGLIAQVSDSPEGSPE